MSHDGLIQQKTYIPMFNAYILNIIKFAQKRRYEWETLIRRCTGINIFFPKTDVDSSIFGHVLVRTMKNPHRA